MNPATWPNAGVKYVLTVLAKTNGGRGTDLKVVPEAGHGEWNALLTCELLTRKLGVSRRVSSYHWTISSGIFRQF